MGIHQQGMKKRAASSSEQSGVTTGVDPVAGAGVTTSGNSPKGKPGVTTPAEQPTPKPTPKLESKPQTPASTPQKPAPKGSQKRPYPQDAHILFRDYSLANAQKGQLSWWQYLWNLIKMWFGSKEGETALNTHKSRTAAIEQEEKDVDTGLSNYLRSFGWDGKSPLTPEQELAANRWMQQKAKSKARGYSAAENTGYILPLLPKGTKLTEQDLNKLWVNSGMINTEAPGSENLKPERQAFFNNPEFKKLRKELQDEIRDRSKRMTRVMPKSPLAPTSPFEAAPSWKSQLYGDTGASGTMNA